VSALLIFSSWIGYVQYEDSENLKKWQAYINSRTMVDKISIILDCANKCAPQTTLDWIPKNFTPAQREQFLRTALKNNQELMKKNEVYADREIGANWKLMEAVGIKWILPLFGSLGVLLFFWGFHMWKIKIQLPSDNVISLDIKIRELNLRKAALELDQEATLLEISIRKAVLRKSELEIQQISKSARLSRRR